LIIIATFELNYFLFHSEREAKVMKANSWLYHYYMVQSRLQYSLAYGGQSPTALAAFYPQTAFGGHQGFDSSPGVDAIKLFFCVADAASQT
jgi:hypothetical protein